MLLLLLLFDVGSGVCGMRLCNIYQQPHAFVVIAGALE